MERAALEMIEVYQVQNYIKEVVGLDDKTLEHARIFVFQSLDLAGCGNLVKPFRSSASWSSAAKGASL